MGTNPFRRTRYAKFYREFAKADAEVVGRVEQHIVAQSEVHLGPRNSVSEMVPMG